MSAPAAMVAPSPARLFQWATEDGVHGTPLVADLEAAGWRRGPAHPLFRGTWLMERVGVAVGRDR